MSLGLVINVLKTKKKEIDDTDKIQHANYKKKKPRIK